MITLADLQTAQFMQAAGFCPSTNEQFLEILNDAVNELLIRGDWPGTLMPIRVCIRNGCVTWPRHVGSVRKINSCNASVPMGNQWFQFMEHGHSRGPEAWYNSWGWRGGCLEGAANYQFRAPTYNDPYGVNCYIRIYPKAQEDVGATVQIFGLDGNNQPLMTRNSDGTWSDGITITVPEISVSTPYGSSDVTVSRIDRVVKSVTQNDLIMYAYDSENDWLFDLARYQPSETNPSYVRYQIATGGPWTRATAESACMASIVALVKLQPIPIKVASDLVIIDNRRALLNAIRALKAEEGGNQDVAQGFWQMAIETMNRSLEDASPDFTFAAKNNVYGGRTFANRMF